MSEPWRARFRPAVSVSPTARSAGHRRWRPPGAPAPSSVVATGSRRGRRFLALAVAGAAWVLTTAGPAAVPARADPRPGDGAGYRPPVTGVVVDPFRPPVGPYGPGNRGLEYAVTPGSPVVASADGEVIFAGPVGSTRHVTLRHPDGLRTSYSFLAVVLVRRGQQVTAGQVLGVAGPVLHFGVRDPTGTYLDPDLLLSGMLHPGVRLVPLEGGDDPTVERRALGAVVASARSRWGGTGSAVTDMADLAGDSVGGWPAVWSGRVAARLAEVLGPQPPCTPADQAPPARPDRRRILVLVGGLGSTSTEAAVDRIESASVGYAPGDVLRFSYRGGRIPSDRPVSSDLKGVATNSYTAADSQQDLAASGASLRALLEDVARAAPGVPIDVVAHSQGGLVARWAITSDPDTAGAGAPEPVAAGRGMSDPSSSPTAVATLVTLSTPHQGADLATGVSGMRTWPGGGPSTRALAAMVAPDLDLSRPAIGQMDRRSDFLARMKARRWPAGVRVVSVGARGDLVVASPRAVVDGAANTVVPLVGLDAHDRLPGAPEVARELALARSGWPPTCRGLGARLGDLILGEGIAAGEQALTPGRPG